MMKARVLHMSRLQSKVKKADIGLKSAAVRALRSLVTPVETEAKRKVLSGPKTGRIYVRNNPRRVHQASAPGQAPANDTGRLVASIEADVDPQQFNLVLSASAPHARPLELGTKDMAPRPFLRKTLWEFRQRVINALHAAMKGEF